jgi:hypothetical protein
MTTVGGADDLFFITIPNDFDLDKFQSLLRWSMGVKSFENVTELPYERLFRPFYTRRVYFKNDLDTLVKVSKALWLCRSSLHEVGGSSQLDGNVYRMDRMGLWLMLHRIIAEQGVLNLISRFIGEDHKQSYLQNAYRKAVSLHMVLSTLKSSPMISFMYGHEMVDAYLSKTYKLKHIRVYVSGFNARDHLERKELEESNYYTYVTPTHFRQLRTELEQAFLLARPPCDDDDDNEEGSGIRVTYRFRPMEMPTENITLSMTVQFPDTALSCDRYWYRLQDEVMWHDQRDDARRLTLRPYTGGQLKREVSVIDDAKFAVGTTLVTANCHLYTLRALRKEGWKVTDGHWIQELFVPDVFTEHLKEEIEKKKKELNILNGCLDGYHKPAVFYQSVIDDRYRLKRPIETERREETKKEEEEDEQPVKKKHRPIISNRPSWDTKKEKKQEESKVQPDVEDSDSESSDSD